LADQSIDSYQRPLDVLAKHPDVRSSVVDYRELIAQPDATMRRIYRELDLDLGRRPPKHSNRPRRVAGTSRPTAIASTNSASMPAKSIPVWPACSTNTSGTPKEKTRMSTEPNQAALRTAWTDMIDALNRAREAVDSAELHAPPVTAQGLAEGYR